LDFEQLMIPISNRNGAYVSNFTDFVLGEVLISEDAGGVARNGSQSCRTLPAVNGLLFGCSEEIASSVFGLVTHLKLRGEPRDILRSLDGTRINQSTATN
jgi:hypothetical protein